MLRRGGMPLLAALLSLAALAPNASAALNPTLAPYPTPAPAGGHTDFTTDVSFGSDDVRRLTFHLPPGLIGNPNVTPLCPQATFNSGTCPADTQVGTTQVEAQLFGHVPSTSNGKVYNLEPSPGEPARLGVVVQTDPFGLTGTIKIPVSASLRPTDGGLDATTATDIPNSVMGVPLHVSRQVLTLQGQPPAASGPFMTNPTGCPNPPDQVGVEATSYSSSTPETDATDFPVTGCELLPFAPQMIAAADVSGGSAPGTHIALSTLITQGSGEANPRRVTVTLPDSIKADTDAIGRTCPPANLAAHTCPDSSRIGSALAITPLLSKPVSGPVYVTGSGSGLLGFVAQLSGQVDLEVSGYANTPNNIIVSTFDNVPDVPISYFALSFDAGPNGSLLAAKDLCSAPPQSLNADILAHSGATASLTPAMPVMGCPAKPGKPPQATVTLKHVGRPRPTVGVRIVSGGPELTGATVKLPRQLTLKRHRGRVKVQTTARAKAKLSRHRVRITNVPAGATHLDLTLAKGAVRSSPPLRRKVKHGARPKLRFAVTVQQKDAAAATLHVTATAKR